MQDVLERISALRGPVSLSGFCRKVGINYDKLKKAFQRETVPDPKTLLKIARHFHVDLAWLIAGDGPPSPLKVRAGKRLRALRRQRGWSLDKLAERMQVPCQVLSWYEQGTGAMALDFVPALCKGMGLMPWELFSDPPAPFPPPELKVALPNNLKGSPPLMPEDYVCIPLTSSAIAAGEPIIQENNIEDYVLLHIRAAGKRGNLVASRVDGDSMEPMLHSGDIVVIDRNDKKISKTKMYAVFYEEGLTAKYLERQKNWLILRPINPNSQVQIVNLYEQADPIVGRIIGAWKEL